MAKGSVGFDLINLDWSAFSSKSNQFPKADFTDKSDFTFVNAGDAASISAAAIQTLVTGRRFADDGHNATLISHLDGSKENDPFLAIELTDKNAGLTQWSFFDSIDSE